MGLFSSVKAKIVGLLFGVSVMSTLLIGGYFIVDMVHDNKVQTESYEKNLNEEFDREIKLQVEQAISAVDAIYQQEKKGVLTHEQATEEARNVLRTLRYDDGKGYFWVDTVEGVCVVHAIQKEKVEGKFRLHDKDTSGAPYIELILNSAKEGNDGYSNFRFPKPGSPEPDSPKRGYAKEFKPYHWVICTGNYIDDIEAKVQEYEAAKANDLKRRVMVSVMILLVFELLIVGVGSRYVKGISKPIQAITDGLDDMADGVFRGNETVAAYQKNSDELGSMAVAFHKVTEQMRMLVGSITESSEKVAELSNQLSGATQESATATQQVSQSITAVAESTNKQLEEIQAVSTTVDNIAEKMQTISEKSVESADKAVQVYESAQTGAKEAKSAIEEMKAIEVSVNETSTAITALGKSSAEIGQIVDTISGIADQTNLLALNAAIEAARAGEAGKGFSVVAEEVRKLAEQSGEAAKNIATLLQEVQNTTQKAVSDMNASTTEFKKGAAIVNQSGETFLQIVSLIDGVVKQVKSISSSMHDMAVDTAQMTNSMKNISAMSENISAETQNVSASTQEQNGFIRSVENDVDEVSKMIGELQNEIKRFKV